MNLNLESPKKNLETGAAKYFRRLRWNELVVMGDFVGDENRPFEPWHGPSGFQADSFLKPIYRTMKTPRARRRS